MYEKQLDAAASYLVGRGIDHQAAISCRLGVVSEPMPGHEQYRGRLVIPYTTPAGVVFMKFRDMTGEARVKYLGPEGQQPRLYNAGVLANSPKAVAICEGELDAIVMQYRVGVPAVGVAGASTWMAHYPRCFGDVETVFIVADNDDSDKNAGQNLARKILHSLPRATNIVPPTGMDLNEWFLASGADVIKKAMGL